MAKSAAWSCVAGQGTVQKPIAMLCQNCRGLPPEVVDERSRVAASRPGWERLRNVMCETCGGVLPPEDADGRLLERLSRLARFGLVAGAAPILKR